MKYFYLLIALISLNVGAQDITGQWHGVLKIQGAELRLAFNIEKTESGYTSTMDSPDQGAIGIPVSNTSFEDSALKISASNMGIEYEGVLDKNKTITGTFKQGGMSIPLNLSREKIENKVARRPQDPVKPYPYHSEDITFKNSKANIELAGTLTLPNTSGVFPVVVLISGSGAQDRNQEIVGHKPFLVISDYLTKNGIGVLRFDDRGTALSGGDFASSSSADFATDVEAAVNYLKTRKEVNKNEIGLIGHSEGGIIAPMLAKDSKDIAFIVLLAGPGIPGDELLLSQQEAMLKALGTEEKEMQLKTDLNRKGFEMVKKSSNDEQLRTDLTNIMRTSVDDILKSQGIEDAVDDKTMVNPLVDQLMSPWIQFFIKYDPAPTLEKVKCPVLALNGSNDLQVLPKENLSAIENALKKGGNKDTTVKELPGLNHLFQESKTGLVDEYADIEQTFSPIALEKILQWIQIQTK